MRVISLHISHHIIFSRVLSSRKNITISVNIVISFDHTGEKSPHLFASNSLLKRRKKKKNGPFLPKLQGKPFVRGVFFVKNFPFPHVNHKFGQEQRHIASGTIARSMTRWQKVHFEGASLSSSSSFFLLLLPPPLHR